MGPPWSGLGLPFVPMVLGRGRTLRFCFSGLLQDEDTSVGITGRYCRFGSSPRNKVSLKCFASRGPWRFSLYSTEPAQNAVALRLKNLHAVLCLAAQSHLTLWDSKDFSQPGSSVHGILQARTLEWVAISFSNAWKRKVKVKSLSCARLLATPWTGAYQAPPFMGFSRQEYWSGVPLSSLTYTLNLTYLSAGLNLLIKFQLNQ